MPPVFLDTSGIIAVVNTRDQWHGSAAKAWDELIRTNSPLVTTSLVLIELGDGLSRIRLRELAVAMRDQLTRSHRVEVVQVEALDEQRGWDLYRHRSDKAWSVTDCISMVIIERRGIQRVFTADQDFTQAGLEVLLPSPP